MTINGQTPASEPGHSLKEVRILDAATLLAGPLAASLLGDLGADVIKIEMPGKGDPLRGYPPFRDHVSLIHKVTNRNKKAVTLRLSEEDGRDIFRDLVRRSDIVVMNFRPATLEKWHLTYEDLQRVKKDIVMLQVSAYGDTGPYRDRPGFARIAEAFCGLAHITGYPDRAPVLAGYPVIDSVTGLFGAFSILAALRQRDRTGEGVFVDVGLYEPMLRLMEDLLVSVPYGIQRARIGNRNPYVAPNDLYECQDGHYIVLPISTDQVFSRLADVIQKPELKATYPSNALRLEHREEIDTWIAQYLMTVTSEEALKTFTEAEVPAAPIYSPQDILRDPHIAQRGNVQEVYDEELGELLTMQAPLPLGHGTVRFPGRQLGQDNVEIFQELLGYAPESIRQLEANKTI